MSPAPLALEPGDAHLWYVAPEKLTDPELLALYRAWLAPDERQRHSRYRFDKHRHEYLITRALVRWVLSRYAPVAPAEWQFDCNEHGRPHIRAPAVLPRLRFNLSNTQSLVACLVAEDLEIGVDVEEMDRSGETVAIADRFFSPTEVVDLRALPPERQRARFFEYWTLKESYIKAKGKGLAIPLEQFSFHLSPEGPVRISFDPRLGDDPGAWQFIQQRPTPRHQVAVALRRGSAPDHRLHTRWILPGIS
jgi:4'-phosphopantetheinyl transferase